MKDFTKRFKNTNGQVSIFIALIFQVLFLFFAMIVNVGLLVHHKINLQNSVDLAAYYGAMKQAESMNAIAHLNYQIRQSWKLLAWRYRVIGMGGDQKNHHPYNLTAGQLNSGTNGADESIDPLARADKDMYLKPGFCATYVPFDPMPSGESTCRDMFKPVPIGIFAPPASTGVVPVSIAIRAATITAINSIKDRCEFVGPFNWLLLARFKVAFVTDTAERKKAIYMLANGLSGVGSPGGASSDFRELDGNFASVGIQKTLNKNLTIQNRNSLNEFKVYNGLGDSSCGINSSNIDKPPKWLNDVIIRPAFVAYTSDCKISGSSGGTISLDPVNIEDTSEPQNEKPRYVAGSGFEQEIAALKLMVNSNTPPYNTTLGVEKNPWCMEYVGVKASTRPKIPFMPLGEVTLTAKSYAKPFGGRIGPWFFNQWQPGSAKSGGTDKVSDALIPKRLDDIGAMPAENDPTRIPNYARFPGDKKGLMSRAILGLYTKAIFQMQGSNNPGASHITKLITSSEVDPVNESSKQPSFLDWNNLSMDFSNSGNAARDILAWNNDKDKAPQMRLLEISAIAPDIFDTTYYSIEPNFYQTYYPKINEHIGRTSADINLPSDLGARKDDNRYKDFNIKKQIKVQNDVLNIIDTGSGTPGPQLEHLIKNVDHVLTSWSPNNLLEYDFDESKFGKCNDPGTNKPKSDGPFIPGDCIGGGRTGFSVKLISGDYLRRSDLQLGGQASQGPINNPPPADF